MAWDDGFWWNSSVDKGNVGDFGGADYIEALKRGGTGSIEELKATRDAVRAWSRQGGQWARGYGSENLPEGESWATREYGAFWNPNNQPAAGVTGEGGLGWEGWGDKSDRSAERGKYFDEEDLWAGLAEGHSYQDLERHFQNTANLSKIREGSNILEKIGEGARDARQKELEEGHAAELKRAEEQRDTALGDLETVKGERASAQSNFEALQTKYDTELQELKRAQAAVRSNAPTSVGRPGSAMGIRFAQSPTLQGKGGFRGTLAGLTRQSGPASKLKVQTLNV